MLNQKGFQSNNFTTWIEMHWVMFGFLSSSHLTWYVFLFTMEENSVRWVAVLVLAGLTMKARMMREFGWGPGLDLCVFRTSALVRSPSSARPPPTSSDKFVPPLDPPRHAGEEHIQLHVCAVGARVGLVAGDHVAGGDPTTPTPTPWWRLGWGEWIFRATIWKKY